MKIDELTEKLTIATKHNEAIGNVLKQISTEESIIRGLNIDIQRGKENISDMETKLAKAKEKQRYLEQHLRHGQEKIESLSLSLSAKIDEAPIKRAITLAKTKSER